MEWPYKINIIGGRRCGLLKPSRYCRNFIASPWLLMFFVSFLVTHIQAQTNPETPSVEKPARINPTGRTLELHTTLRNGETVVGSVLLSISSDDAFSFSAAGISELLTGSLLPQVLQKVNGRAQDGRLRPDDFIAEGIELKFNPSAFELVLNIPKALQRDTLLSLNRNTDNRKYLSPADISGYLNLRLGATSKMQKDSESNSHIVSQSHSIETAVRALQTVLEVEARYDKPSGEEGGEFYRQSSRLVYDVPQSATRIVAGDIFTFGSQLQDSSDLLGLGISRNFDLIPSRNVRPSAARRFRLLRPSDVDVFVDGVLVRRLSLQAGVFNLQDIPLASGSNDVELVIEDGDGEIERISFSVATAQELLPSGEFDYSIAAGIQATPGKGGPVYDENNSPVATATARYGVAPWLTLGLDAQGSKGLRQLGGSALFATTAGRFNIALATSSIDKRGDGHALSLGYDADFGRSNPKEKRFLLQADMLSPQFGGIDATPTDELALSDSGTTVLNNSIAVLNASYSQRLSSHLRGSIGFGYSHFREPSDTTYTLRTSVSGAISNTPASWNISLGLQDNKRDGSDVTAFMSLTWPLDKYSRLRFNSTAPDASQQVHYNYNRNTGRVGGIQANLSAETDQDHDASLSGDIEYTANRFRTSLAHESRLTQLSGRERNHTTRARFETSLAFADGNVAIGRPISNSFAIIRRHDSLANNTLRVDQTERGELVHSDWLGNVLVPNLGTYRGQQLNYDVADLPLGYDLGEGAFSVKPPYQAGYSLQVGSDATVTMIGTLIDSLSGEALGLIAGEAVYQNDPDVEPIIFFSNRKGRFAISGMRPGDYLLKLTTQPVRSHRVVIEAGTTALLRVGEIKVK
ncbi:MAG: fimbria/pilus outer membrane usher protein [Oceanospirillaceae bacterium]